MHSIWSSQRRQVGMICALYVQYKLAFWKIYFCQAFKCLSLDENVIEVHIYRTLATFLDYWILISPLHILNKPPLFVDSTRVEVFQDSLLDIDTSTNNKAQFVPQKCFSCYLLSLLTYFIPHSEQNLHCLQTLHVLNCFMIKEKVIHSPE